MKHRILAGLLGLGAIAGFASGFFSLGARAHARRAAFERHVADVCVEAAREAREADRSLAPRRSPTERD